MYLYNNDFVLPPDRRAMIGEFFMPIDDLIADLRSGPDFGRPDLESTLRAIMQAGLIGAGMDPVDARKRAFLLFHEGLYSSTHSAEIVLKLLTE